MADSVNTTANLRDSLQGMRIAFVFETLELGGSERQALLFARYLKDEIGADVHVVGLNSPGRAVEICEELGIPWNVAMVNRYCGHRKRVPMVIRFAWSLRRLRPDVLLPYTIGPNVLCGLVWRWSGARTCVWNQRDDGMQRMPAGMESKAVRRTPRFISNSTHGSRFLTDSLGVDPRKTSVIYNGVQLVPPESDRAAWRNRLGISDSCFAATMVANLHRYKDHATLLRAWRTVVDALSKQSIPAMLLLAGRPAGSEAELEQLAADLALGDSVRFLGGVKDISGLLSASDIGVHSSVNEGCPNGVLESMASGLAVAATDIDAIREVVGEAGYSLLSPPGDPVDLARKIISLAESSELRAQHGTMNKTRIEQEFRTEIMCRKTAQIIVDSMNMGRR